MIMQHFTTVITFVDGAYGPRIHAASLRVLDDVVSLGHGSVVSHYE